MKTEYSAPSKYHLHRISAWSRAISQDPIIQHYHTDLIHDGGMLSRTRGPIIATAGECGTHMSPDPEWMRSVYRVRGDGDHIHWYLGRDCEPDMNNGYLPFEFVRLSAEECFAEFERLNEEEEKEEKL